MTGRPEARLLDLAYDAIFTLALPESIITYWNRGAEDLYGWRASEALGQKSYELLQTVHGRPRSEIVAELIRSRRWSGSILQTRRDGTQMMVDARWALETDAAGRPVGILEINRDVTELRTTMSQLEFTNQVSAHLNSSLVPEAVLDRLLTLAVAAAQATHATVARIEDGDGIVEASQDARGLQIPTGLRWPLSVPSALEAVQSRRPTSSGPDELDYLAENLRAHLGELPYRLYIPLVMGEQVIGLLLVGRHEAAFSREQQTAVERMAIPAALALRNSRLFEDAVRQREAAVRSEAQLRAAIEVGQELASEPELGTMLRHLLTRAVSMAGADGGSICKLEDDELVVEDSVDVEGVPHEPHAHIPASPATRSALRTRRPVYADSQDVQGLFSVDQQAGQARPPARVVVFPLSVAGEPIGLLNLIRRRPGPFADEHVQGVRQLTAVAALLLQMGRLLQEARKGEAAKREFLNLAGHELRTPLTVLKGYFALINDGTLGTAPDGWRRPMSVIKNELATLERLVESLLVAARTESDQLRPSVRVIDLVAEAQAAIRTAQPRIELEGADCSFEATAETVEALGDPDHLALVLHNLIHNSLDYSRGRAHLSVRVESWPEAAVILVRDSGIGIPADGHDKVFERFVRLAPTLMPTRSGSGLGLFISRSLARGMGGDLVILESELDKGTTMAVKLPKPGQ